MFIPVAGYFYLFDIFKDYLGNGFTAADSAHNANSINCRYHVGC